MNNAFIIAEIGHNHLGDINKAKKMTVLAHRSGASAVKFQLYDVDKIKKPGDTNYDELKAYQLSKDNMFELYEYGSKRGIDVFFSIFDIERLKWTDEIDVSRYKIASRSIHDNELIEEILSRNKPTIASLGITVWDCPWFPKYKEIDYLYCVSRRDVLRGDFNKESMPKHFGEPGEYAGISDHFIGVGYSADAIINGARIIEKHFTLDKNWPGWDQPSSAEPIEFMQLRNI